MYVYTCSHLENSMFLWVVTSYQPSIPTLPPPYLSFYMLSLHFKLSYAKHSQPTLEQKFSFLTKIGFTPAIVLQCCQDSKSGNKSPFLLVFIYKKLHCIYTEGSMHMQGACAQCTSAVMKPHKRVADNCYLLSTIVRVRMYLRRYNCFGLICPQISATHPYTHAHTQCSKLGPTTHTHALYTHYTYC